MNTDQQTTIETLKDALEETSHDASTKTAEELYYESLDNTVKRWVVAVVNNKSEAALCQTLSTKGIEAYIPLSIKHTVWRNGRKNTKQVPLIAAKVFVRCTERERLRDVARLANVKRFMMDRATTNSRPKLMVIPDDDMEMFREAIIRTNGEMTIWETTIAKGDLVRITNGDFKGMVGYIKRTNARISNFIIKIGTFGYGSIILQDCEFIKIPKSQVAKEDADLKRLNKQLEHQEYRLKAIQKKIEEKEKIKNHTRK